MLKIKIIFTNYVVNIEELKISINFGVTGFERLAYQSCII